MRAWMRLVGWVLAVNAAGAAAMVLLGSRVGEAARGLALWCGLG